MNDAADVDQGQDIDAIGASEAQGADVSQQPPAYDRQFPQNDPVPVDVTDTVYGSFREAFGEDEAAGLQRAWGDHAVLNQAVVKHFIADHPDLDQVYVQHQTEAGGLSVDGVLAGLDYLLEKAGIADPLELLKQHPELDYIYNDHADEQGTLSAVGLYRALHYVGKKSGYKFNYRGKR